ncbi:S1 family peptidase [Pectobacterium polaris]|uniref:S1 family peptidase n=1 Tax=Pectobacterium polaris TaxID=2042057 RepID=UPI001F341BA0|nr:serine protease [Pectobacterium polaris]
MIQPAFLVTLGLINAEGINLLGTGFFVASNKIATARHVIKGVQGDIVVIQSGLSNFNEYQDTTNNKVYCINCKVIEDDPIKDLSILEVGVNLSGTMLSLSGFDNISIGDEVAVVGYPHCVEARRVLTLQKSFIGAKVLLSNSGVKFKNAIINIQSRPGQSGSPIISMRDGSVVGLLIGAYLNNFGGGIIVGNINPAELHQTTHCISAEYIKDML